MAETSPSGIPFSIDGVHIEISGIHDEDEFVKDVARKEVINAVKKLLRTAEVTRLVVHVKRSDHDGRRARFDVHMKATAEGAEFHADAVEWDLPKSVGSALHNIESEIVKYVDKRKFHTDHSRKSSR
jgi:ribosome-associated translation inhibitor RaiA